MTSIEPAPEETTRDRVIGETAKIAWRELMREFAGGKTLLVDAALDMVEVACQFDQDNAAQVAVWLDQEQVRAVSDDEARQWHEADQTVWACVVKPWILIQVVKK